MQKNVNQLAPPLSRRDNLSQLDPVALSNEVFSRKFFAPFKHSAASSLYRIGKMVRIDLRANFYDRFDRSLLDSISTPELYGSVGWIDEPCFTSSTVAFA